MIRLLGGRTRRRRVRSGRRDIKLDEEAKKDEKDEKDKEDCGMEE